MQPIGRVIESGPGNAAWNMAVDEALLLSAAERTGPTLRFYQWEQPTLSLGYFQGIAERDSHAASRTCLVVRRTTGGGAILHDQELTYSLTVPKSFRRAIDPLYYYRACHETLVECLAELLPLPSGGQTPLQLWECERCAAEPPPEAERQQPTLIGQPPFLCFQRRSVGDVVFGDSKIVGSAQRKTAQSLLQHGSFLLARSAFAPELPGWQELARRNLDLRQLKDNWQARLSARLGVRWIPEPLTAEETAAAAEVAERRFAATAWTDRR